MIWLTSDVQKFFEGKVCAASSVLGALSGRFTVVLCVVGGSEGVVML